MRYLVGPDLGQSNHRVASSLPNAAVWLSELTRFQTMTTPAVLKSFRAQQGAQDDRALVAGFGRYPALND